MKFSILQLITYTKRSFTKTVNRFSFCIIYVMFHLKRFTELNQIVKLLLCPCSGKFHYACDHKDLVSHLLLNFSSQTLLQRPWFFGKIQYRSCHSHRQLLRLMEVTINNNKCFYILKLTPNAGNKSQDLSIHMGNLD